MTIVSHTSHNYNGKGELTGWSPTVREINFLATKFKKVNHVAVLNNTLSTAGLSAYSSGNINFIPLTPTGGKSLSEKITVVTSISDTIKKINSCLAETDYIQLRLPTGIGNFLLPWFTVNKPQPLLWVKYAGDWKQKNAPVGYRFQKWWLKNNFLKCRVTINGMWDDQPKHCISFENPCLDQAERDEGRQLIAEKNYNPPYTACFVGRMVEYKGLKLITDNLKSLADKKISRIHFVGDGPDKNRFSEIASKQNDIECIFHGNIARNEIPAILKESHFILLPSEAEGFPKAVAEGANYGAVPVVSDVSSIGHYLDDSSSFMWNRKNTFHEWLNTLNFQPAKLRGMATNAWTNVGGFTFENYYSKLCRQIFNDN